MKLMDLLIRLPQPLQTKLAQLYLNQELKKKVRVTLRGTEHLREVKRPCIFVANHLSNIDGVLISRLLKESFDPYFVAGIKLSCDPFTNLFKSLLKTINIKPNSADLESMRSILNTLKQGHSIMIFPEGTRSRSASMNEAKKGILLMARLSGAPIVPIGLMGTEKVMPINDAGKMNEERLLKGEVTLQVGPAFTLLPKAPGEAKHDYEDRALRDLMEHIARLVAEPYRGVYATASSKDRS
ncbi:1-acyl-sn-glycerol-3-phosphate acyltransferase [Clostridiaceae bacterium JG1575]|nr:1-acyl-sn-glycerol-3-phosphate acyltransferase [Clostridiaceae bacterium JG1575]